MIKISTLYKKNQSNLALVIDEVDEKNAWALTEGIATRKYDGTACAIINGEIYKRYDAKHGKQPPEGAIPCDEPDAITGHWPHWLKCNPNNKEDKYFFEGLSNFDGIATDGTYELCGPKVNGNKENLTNHYLIKHGAAGVPIKDRSFEGCKNYLSNADIEGIVFHHSDGRMCKIRKSDFDIKR